MNSKEIRRSMRQQAEYRQLVFGGRMSKKFKGLQLDLKEELEQQIAGSDYEQEDPNMEPLHFLREEQEDLCDDQGNLKRKPQKYDPWFQSIQGIFKKKQQSESSEQPQIDTAKLLNQLKKHLQANQTVGQCLKRKRGSIKNKPPLQFDKLTEICCDLVSQGYTTLYEWKQEDFNNPMIN